MEKAIETLFKGQESSKSCIEFSKELGDLRVLKKGGILLQLPEGRKLIITMGHENQQGVSRDAANASGVKK